MKQKRPKRCKCLKPGHPTYLNPNVTQTADCSDALPDSVTGLPLLLFVRIGNGIGNGDGYTLYFTNLIMYTLLIRVERGKI